MTSSYDAAVDLLHEATTDDGILASTTDHANYRRVWCRDGVVCGLAGLLTGEARLVDGHEQTLRTLADHQGPDGQIPSNVRVADGEVTDVSYGGVCGRVDTLGWFVVGVLQHAALTGRDGLAAEMNETMERALELFSTWEFNRRGLVYVPQGGDWADEYVLRGYILHVQLLRLWALRLYADWADDDRRADEADALQERLERNYWPTEEADAEETYHRWAYQRYVAEHGEPTHWLAALAPSGYFPQFDGWSNALAILLGLGDEARQTAILDYGAEVIDRQPTPLVPAFWPPVLESDPLWADLRNNCRDSFSNRPGRYHNGGLWPVVNGWWGCALVARRRGEDAEHLRGALSEANLGGGVAETPFPEYLDASDGTAAGVTPCTWSAAGLVLLERALDGETLYFS